MGLNEVNNASQQYESIANHIGTHHLHHSSEMVSFQFDQFLLVRGSGIVIGLGKMTSILDVRFIENMSIVLKLISNKNSVFLAPRM